MIVDSSALLVLVDSDEPDHSAVSLLIAGSREPLIVSPYDLLRCADIVEHYGTSGSVSRMLRTSCWLPGTERDA